MSSRLNFLNTSAASAAEFLFLRVTMQKMQLDLQIFHLLNNLAGQSSFLDGSIVFLAKYLAYILILFFGVLVFLSDYTKRKKWEVLIVAGAASVIARYGVTELIRFFYHRPRPFLAFPDIHKLLNESSWSFPSGHATFFFALSTAVYLYNKKWGAFFFIATILMTFSRVAAGIHYPSDIVGGAVVGVMVAYATFYAAQKVAKYYNDSTGLPPL